jgi:transcriptional regulator with PAS, ATPase and Fis domain
VPFTLPVVGSLTIDEMELSMIKKAMEFHKNNISQVARSLGLSRGTLYRKLEKYQIPYEAQK